jgi:predicted nucleic acid-binding protein
MLVITNTTPLIFLARRSLFSFLRHCYGKVFLPQAVWREVVEEGKGRAGEQETKEARTTGWMEVRDLQEPQRAQGFRETFGLGPDESEVIALAQECAADLLLLDDDQAVKVARELGFMVRRTPGLLALTKEWGYLTTVKEHLDALRAEGLWLSAQVYRRILRDVGEEP